MAFAKVGVLARLEACASLRLRAYEPDQVANGYAVTVNAARNVHAAGFVVIDDAKISVVGPSSVLLEDLGACENSRGPCDRMSVSGSISAVRTATEAG